MMHSRKIILAVIALVLSGSISFADKFVNADSRVNTIVYNENEVYRIMTAVGFQSSIEFGHKEEIQAISTGEKYTWKIIPTVDRIFIKPIKRGQITNMTVITNKRVYHFELASAKSRATKVVYVTRFFYPDIDLIDDQNPEAAKGVSPIRRLPSGVVQLDTVRVPPLPTLNNRVNLNYTLAGPESISPVKVFDNGRATYLQFDRSFNTKPRLAIVKSGSEIPVNYRTEGFAPQMFIIIDTVTPVITLKAAGEQVCIFNENMSTAPTRAAKRR